MIFVWFDLLALRLQSFLITLNFNDIAILHTFSSLLHKHYDSPGNGSQQRNYHFKSLWSLLVSWSSVTLEPRNLTEISVYYSLLQLTTARKRPLLSPINPRRGPTENTSRGRYPLLGDVTANAEVCLSSCCLETGCITRCSIVACVYYLETAVPVAQPFLNAVNRPH
jgi:hypothetical protein